MIISSAISRVFWLKNTKAGLYQFMNLNIHQNTKYKLWLRFHWILKKSYFYGIFMGYKKNTQRKR
ncbi:hypothetical protein [Helicobacter pylori]|uniref:hypothetical protein n=1 Tax=Helicobacter pylori TaxID=210 RepID=UPI002159CE71|nr:hypothetical protein [Helicobacter pylori]